MSIINIGPSRKIIGLGITILSSFALLSLLSYFSHWSYDQDKIFFFPKIWDYLSSDVQARNLGGRLGAVISHLLMYQGIGIFSIALVLYHLYFGLRLLRAKSATYFSETLLQILMTTLIVAPLITWFSPDDGFPWGGAYGKASWSFLSKFLGNLGAGFLLIVALVAFIYYRNQQRFQSSGQLAHRTSKLAQAVQHFYHRLRENTFHASPVTSELATAASAPQTSSPILEESAPEKDSSSTQILDESPQKESHNDIPDWIKIAEDDTPENSTSQQPTSLEESLMPSPPSKAKKSQREPEPEPKTQAPDNPKTNPKGVYLEMPHPAKSTSNSEIDEDPEIEIKLAVDDDESSELDGASIAMDSPDVPYDPKADLRRYKYPELDLLEVYKSEKVALDKEAIKNNIDQITSTLENFNIQIDIRRTTATVGPTVTLYEIVPAKGVRISKIKNLEDDIALSLAALGIRIIAPIPGKGTIGIEVPNENRQMVGLRSILADEKFRTSNFQLPLALGKRIDNKNVVIDLAAMPHLLVAGATGQGKSVGINTILISLLYKLHPSQIKFVLIDPKKVELSVYRLIEKHFLAKLPEEEEAIITDTKKVVSTLNSLCVEMDERYELLKNAGARNLKEYNEKFVKRKLNPKKGHKYLPFIVLVIDEFADLIMTAGKEVENPLARLAQLARAVGIHLIVATQRPDTKVITGTIKANFPARIAFKVSSQFDSRTILDTKGAEQLIGKGDMLLSAMGDVSRIQCAFVDTHEVEQVVDFIGQQQGYPVTFELPEYVSESDESEALSRDVLQKRDKLFEECARMVVSTQKGSTSMLQRKFNLGYNRAGRIMDQLEAAAIVGPSTGGKPREVYVSSDMELEELLRKLDEE